MPPLDAAFAFAQMNYFSMLVAQNLKLDVPGMLEKLFRVHIGRSKCLLRLAPSRLVSGQKLILLAHHTHAAPASARRSFQNEWIPDAGGLFRELLLPFNNALAPRNGRQAGGLHFPSRTVLFPHHLDDFRPRADERDFRCFADLGKISVLREEPVPRM